MDASRSSTRILPFVRLVAVIFFTLAILTVDGRFAASQAATVQCGSAAGITASNNVDISGYVVTNTGCEIGTLENDPTSLPLVINTEGFFGSNDWNFVSKTDVNATDGTFNVAANLWNVYSSIMLIFKGPDANAPFEPNSIVGYLLNPNDTSVGYTSPFSKGTGGVTTGPDKFGLANVSHISVYGVSAVPLPAAFPLFGGALALLGIFGWRRRSLSRT